MSLSITTNQRLAGAIAAVTISGIVAAFGGGASHDSSSSEGTQHRAASASVQSNIEEVAGNGTVASVFGNASDLASGAAFAAAIESSPKQIDKMHDVIEAATSPAKQPASTAGAGADRTQGNDVSEPPSSSADVRVPQRVTVHLPRYEPGRAPSATAPSIEEGRPPSVEPGWTTTVDLGRPPTISSEPKVDQGEPGRLTPPSVEIS